MPLDDTTPAAPRKPPPYPRLLDTAIACCIIGLSSAIILPAFQSTHQRRSKLLLTAFIAAALIAVVGVSSLLTWLFLAARAWKRHRDAGRRGFDVISK